MTKKKYYFTDMDECHCYSREDTIDLMKENGLTSVKAHEAIQDKNGEYFFCRDLDAILMTSDKPCGKVCSSYAPINGRSGVCEHRGMCHEMGKEVIIRCK